MASIGSIVGGAFSLIRERPGAVVAWGVAYLLGSIAVALVVGLLGMAMGAGMGADGRPHGGAFFLDALLFYIGYFLLLAILMNAVFRSILRPAEQRFFSLRLGGDEVRMLGLILLVLIGSIVIGVVAQLMLMLLAMVVGLAAGGNPLVAGLGGILLMIAYLCGFIWVGVRISLVYPLTFYRRAITLDEAWSLTAGRFWTLFGSYLVIGVVLLVVFGSLFWLSFGEMVRSMAQAGNDPFAQQAALGAAVERLMAVPLAIRLLVGLIWWVVLVIGSALWHGMIATATRELLLEQGEVLGEDAEDTAAIFE